MSTDQERTRTPASAMVTDVIDTASGKADRHDAVLGRSGGPAGNARITALTGLVLLVLIAVETFTVLDVRGMIGWHIVVGTILVPVALLKTATTGWRMGRYYTGHRPYTEAGPPPMLLRLLGPLVVISTLGVLATGLLLILQGPDSGRQSFALGLDMLTLHQGLFIAFAVATGLHILTRVVPAVILTTGKLQRGDAERPRVPGRPQRVTALLAALVVGAIAATLVLGASTDWRKDRGGEFDHQRPPGAAARP